MVDAVRNLNGTLWIFASLLIGWVIVQAMLFYRLAMGFNKKNNLLSDEEVKSAVRTGAVSVFGPAVSVVVVALSLISMVGSATTFMRCGVIGAPSWELLMANTSADAAGVAFGSAGFTENIFVLCIFGMVFASAPYFINTIITLKPLDLAVKAASADKSKPSFIPTLGKAAMMGMMGYSLYNYVTNKKMVPALLASAATAFAVQKLAKMTGQKWLKDFSMAFSMVIGMAVAQICAVTIFAA